MLKADIVQKEVFPPANNYCSSGHIAPAEFRRSGPDSIQEPMRFFELSGKGLSGIYCEACLVVAHHLAKRKRNQI